LVTLRGAVFDLDDTLFLERTYILSGFVAVANDIAATYRVEPSEIVREFLVIEAGGAVGRVFDAWLQGRDHVPGRPTVQLLVDSYRSHRPNISLLPGVLQMLQSLRNAAYRLAVVSDGPLQSQTAKVQALGLEHLMDRIVLTDQWGSDFWKPHRRAFELLESEWSCSPSELVYVGDNPRKDFAGPKSRGWLTIRLRLEDQRLHGLEASDVESSAEVELKSVEELSSFLLANATAMKTRPERPDR
jgi:putative hydrolase of the HAD superfamily